MYASSVIRTQAIPASKKKSKFLHNQLASLRLKRRPETGDGGFSALDSFTGSFGNNPQGSKKELVLDIIDFFDYDGTTCNAVNQYKYSVNNFNIVPPDTNAISGAVPQKNVGKVTSVKLWALPAFSLDTDSSAVMVLFGVPVNAYGNTAIVGDPITGIDQQSYKGTAGQMATVLTPTSVSDWVMVGKWDATSLFGDSNFYPAYDDGSNQALFTYSVVDPDSGAATTTKIQFMVEVVQEQTLPILGSVDVGIFSGQTADLWDQAVTVAQQAVSKTPAMISLRKIQNSI